jgi:hypothetical protein
MAKRTKKLLISALVVGVLGSVAAMGVFGLFSATTQNSGNELRSGTVAISDNDSGQAMFNVTGAKPGDSWERCIKVTYTGSLAADVRIYMVTPNGPLAEYIDVKMEQGSQASSTFPTCTGFTPDATGTFYEGPSASPVPGNWDLSIPVIPAGATAWNTGDSLVFRITQTLSPATPDTLQQASTGVTAVVWEARNQ